MLCLPLGDLILAQKSCCPVTALVQLTFGAGSDLGKDFFGVGCMGTSQLLNGIWALIPAMGTTSAFAHVLSAAKPWVSCSDQRCWEMHMELVWHPTALPASQHHSCLHSMHLCPTTTAGSFALISSICKWISEIWKKKKKCCYVELVNELDMTKHGDFFFCDFK